MAAQKKLEPGSEYAKYDLDGDGIVTDEELAMDEKLLRLQDLKSDIENEDKKEDANSLSMFVEGIELTEKQLISSLEKFKINKIDTINEPFDPNLHQAMFEVDGKDSEAGKISEVIQDGYTIGDRLLRPAMVGVFKSKKS